MSWMEIKARFAALAAARDEEGGDVAGAWAAFTQASTAEPAPPFHLMTLIEEIAAVSRDYPGTPPSELVVLDHGCGSGITLLYLAANGHRRIVGVDVGGPLERWNDVLIDLGVLDRPAFFRYDGRTLPLEDASVHLAFSQQVLEHVAPDVVDAYYAEEGRVLKVDGRAYHQVPHRFVPYESHSRTWFIHYLPRPAAVWLYRCLGRANATITDQLFLRSPGFHKRSLKRHIGSCKDVTGIRLTRQIDPRYYDGPVRLRMVIGMLLRAPIIGGIARIAFGRLMMIDTVSIKRSASAQAGG